MSATTAIGQTSSPDFALLAMCCRNRCPEIPSALSHRIRWDEVLGAAERHRVLPVMYLRLCGRSDVPAGFQESLRSQFMQHAHQALRLSSELKRVLQSFRAKGIDCIAHKGPVLAHLVYGDFMMRQFGDLDLLVRKEDVQKAGAVLSGLGYERRPLLPLWQESAYLRSGYEHVYGSAQGKNLIEVQWQIVPRFYSVRFAMKELFERAVTIEFEGTPVQVLSNEDLLLTLCVHAAKHGWDQLGMVRDIAAVASRDLDWAWTINEAKRLGILRILSASLLLAEEIAGAQLCQHVSARDESAGEPLALAVRSRMECSPPIKAGSFDYFRQIMETRERWRDRAQMVARLFLTPGLGEWNAIDVPSGLSFLYYAVRAGRLARRAWETATTRGSSVPSALSRPDAEPACPYIDGSVPGS